MWARFRGKTLRRHQIFIFSDENVGSSAIQALTGSNPTFFCIFLRLRRFLIASFSGDCPFLFGYPRH